MRFFKLFLQCSIVNLTTYRYQGDKAGLVGAMVQMKLQMPNVGANLKDAIVVTRDVILDGSMADNEVPMPVWQCKLSPM